MAFKLCTIHIYANLNHILKCSTRRPKKKHARQQQQKMENKPFNFEMYAASANFHILFFGFLCPIARHSLHVRTHLSII